MEELLAEAARAGRVCQAQGIMTVAGMIASQAEELEAEIARVRERAG